MSFFQPNPVYTYNYQVANDDEQTYIAHTENRDGAQVNGEYSYVDPNGALVTVRYTANDVDGYTETRDVQENFVEIRAKPVVTQIVEARPAPPPPPPASNTDLVARIIAQLTPFIRETVSTTLTSQQQVRVAPPVVVQPPVQTVTSVESRFGAGGINNIRVETPEYQFATDF